MIYINGIESSISNGQFGNLNEMIAAGFEEISAQNQIITHVILNDKPFSEIYPHQAEDISASSVDKLEIFSLDLNQMAYNITEELYKVTKSIELGSIKIANLLRQGDDAEGFELLTDLIEVQRSFLNMIATLRVNFTVTESPELISLSERFSEMLSEILSVMDNEDWVLLSDFLEFELAPICQEWDSCLGDLKTEFASHVLVQ